ncbi:MAG: AI-2E family transporter [Planctomycetes bacterium]|nr:AI-2E family transporter [Planctomycetota bacterium]
MRSAHSHQAPVEAKPLDARPSGWGIAVKLGVVAALLFVVWYAGRVLLLAVAGVLLGVLLSAASGWLHRWTRIRESVCLGVVLVSLVAAVAGLGWWVGETVAAQAAELSRALPEAVKSVRTSLEQHTWGRWIVERLPDSGSILSSSQTLTRVTGFASTSLSILLDVVVIFFVGAYAAAEPKVYVKGFLHLLPKPRRARAGEVIEAVGTTLRWWMAGKLCSMAIVGLLIGIGLWIIGIKLALVLALVAMVLELVPNFGPLIAAVPAVLLSLLDKGTSVWAVVGLYAGVQMVESYLLLPLIQRRTVYLPPAVTILALILLGWLGGVLGVLVATPLTAAAMVVIKMLYVQDVLDDHGVVVTAAGDRQDASDDDADGADAKAGISGDGGREASQPVARDPGIPR